MSAVADILAELSSRGVAVRADGETLRLKPRAALDDGLLARVHANKRDILGALSGRPATCALSCYEIEPGKRIHRPWDGCNTLVAGRDPYFSSLVPKTLPHGRSQTADFVDAAEAECVVPKTSVFGTSTE